MRGAEGGEPDGVGVASLSRIIQEHSEYIQSTTKGPVCPLTSTSDLSHVIVEDEQKVGHMSECASVIKYHMILTEIGYKRDSLH